MKLKEGGLTPLQVRSNIAFLHKGSLLFRLHAATRSRRVNTRTDSVPAGFADGLLVHESFVCHNPGLVNGASSMGAGKSLLPPIGKPSPLLADNAKPVFRSRARGRGISEI